MGFAIEQAGTTRCGQHVVVGWHLGCRHPSASAAHIYPSPPTSLLPRSAEAARTQPRAVHTRPRGPATLPVGLSECLLATSLDFLTPERAVRAEALAAVMATKGVHVQFPHERMAHQLPCQVVGDLEALRAGGGECFRQRLLHDHRHVEAVLD